jgi:hypothetical protein
LTVLAIVVLSACGKQSTVSPTTKAAPSTPLSGSATATPSKGLLYAVLESRTKTSDGFSLDDTVAIAGLDGYARAKTTFTPLTPPYVGCLGPLFPPQAHTAAGHVFFIDGKGVVRSLGLDRTVSQVATFPVGAQQEASFAVSPDGRHLLGTVLTFPPKSSNPNDCLGGGTGFAPGGWSEDLYAADAGGATRLLWHRAWGQPSETTVLDLVGWNTRGPIATYPAAYGTQGGGPVREGWYGPVVRLDPSSGNVQQHFGSDNCFVDDVASDGSYVCAGMDGIDVFNPDGSVAWKFVKPNEGYLVPLLAPDLQHVAAIGPTILGKDGSNTPIGRGSSSSYDFYPEGWLDRNTVIGRAAASPQNMAVVRLAKPSEIDDLGFRGTFVGVVQS